MITLLFGAKACRQWTLDVNVKEMGIVLGDKTKSLESRRQGLLMGGIKMSLISI
jgi:hypothetical protein